MAKAGLLPTDLLQTVNGKSLLNMSIDKVLVTLKNEPPNGVKIDFLRNGKPMSLTVNKAPEISYDRECTDGNCMDGIGTLTFRDGQYYYVGVCKENRIVGPGKLFVNDKLYYEGEFANENFHGRGKRFYTDGALYDGNFFRGKMYGKGILRVSEKEAYTGMFKQGYPNGFGSYLKEGVTYTGFFSDWDLYFGKYSRNNITYSGYFTDFKLFGYGRMQYKPGDYYEGEIANEQPNGKGFTIKDEENAIYGEFKDGSLVTTISTYSLKGVYIGYFPFSTYRRSVLQKYKFPNQFYSELNFILEDSKSDFNFLLDLRTKRVAMRDAEETAESIMLLSVLNEEKGGQFNYPLNGDKPYFWARLRQALSKEKGKEYLQNVLTEFKSKLGVDYIKGEGIEPFLKKPMTTYTFKIIQPYDPTYELNVVVLECESYSGDVNIEVKIPCAIRK
jgi:hypothetical protein